MEAAASTASSGKTSSGTAATPAATPSAPVAAERINGGQALIRSLELEGTATIFGLPRGALLPGY